MKATLFTFCLFALLAACVTGESTSLPDAYLGRWYYTGSSGGITGGGMGDEPTGYIEIGADNTIASFQEDGTQVGISLFTPSQGPTIFSSEDQWILSTDDGIEEVIQVFENSQVMSLSQNVYDGFGRSYARSR